MSSTAGERLGELRPICRCCFYARFPRIAGESAPAPGVPCHYPCRARLRDFQTPRTLALNALGGERVSASPSLAAAPPKGKLARRSRQLGEATVRKLNGDASVAHGCD
jgi:hypothetical protein